MALARIMKAMGVGVNSIEQELFGEIEIDPAVFNLHARTLLMGGSHRNKRAKQGIIFQFNGYIVDLGFRQKCKDCGREGDRREFNPKNERPPYTCPERACRSQNVVGTAKPERRRYPIEVCRHGIESTQIPQNMLGPDGSLLLRMDHNRAFIPILRLVGSDDPRVRKNFNKDRYVCPTDGEAFPTPELLAQHMEKLQAELDQQFSDAEQQEAQAALEIKEERLADLLRKRNGASHAEPEAEEPELVAVAAEPAPAPTKSKSAKAKETPPRDEAQAD